MEFWLRVGLFFQFVIGHRLFNFIYFNILYPKGSEKPSYWPTYLVKRKQRKKCSEYAKKRLSELRSQSNK